ncbi:alanine racemase [Zhaonella formicivorans]|uniref:alanine racemase n=1 Tax=Zhaonella formicivorans TaxID=2528593 RepID=UPI0010D0367A|nr:D-TA family PLP-dependent enzyme [Zhaonella formicivorans]
MRIENLDTPALVLDLDKLEQNIRDMSAFAKEYNIKLRPHIKAHKIPEIALRQIETGAVGITVAKLGEAEVMAEAGITDILVAYPVVGPEKVERLVNLAKEATVSSVVDNLEQAQALSAAFSKAGLTLPVLVEIDTGLKRCGLAPDKEVAEFAARLQALPGLTFKGLMTHAGHVYGVKDPGEVPRIGRQEGEILVELAALLAEKGIEVEEVSVGSTPTAKHSGKVEGVTEIRPGNYVFYDAIQIGLGVALPERCALTVLCTVVSAPEKGRRIIDAGSKTLALDRGAHGNALVTGYGYLPDWPGWQVARLSEEHGIMESEKSGHGPRLGEKVRIIPNHACPVVNLADAVYVVKAGEIVEKWQVAARGKVT